MSNRVLLLLGLFAQTFFPVHLLATEDRGSAPTWPQAYERVDIADSSTSIYVGSVALSLGQLAYAGGKFQTHYHARVFPLFFMSENGQMEIPFSEEQLAGIRRGERVEITGIARTPSNESREITGYVKPEGPDNGSIKVRVHVSKRIELIFNTRYRIPGLGNSGN